MTRRATLSLCSLSLHRSAIHGMYGFGSVGFDTGELDDLRPLFGFHSDQRAEIRGGPDNRRQSEIGELRLKPAVGKTGIDFLVESVDDLPRRVAGCAYSEPAARLEGWHKFQHGRQVGQEFRTCQRCHRDSAPVAW